jgi:hypothetical protein
MSTGRLTVPCVAVQRAGCVVTTLRVMTARMPQWAGPPGAKIIGRSTWLPNILRVVAVPAMAWLWWALAFLPSVKVGPPTVERWPPTLPVLITDLGVAVFGPLGAAFVVIALVRRPGLAFVSVLLGFVVSAWVTLIRFPATFGFPVNPAERNLILVAVAVASAAGLAIGAVAIRSPWGFGFLGLLAVLPVVSLIGEVLFSPLTDNRWLIRPALAVLLVMIAWRRWSGVLVWPVFFVLFWLLNLAMSAVDYGAQSLRSRGGSQASIGSIGGTMVDFVRSAWRVFLQNSWHDFWPAAVMAAVVVACLWVWRRVRRVGTAT